MLPIRSRRGAVTSPSIVVAKQLHAIEPNIARTLANATFTAGVPLGKAMEHLQKFLTSIAERKDHPDVARPLARAGFRAD